MMELRIINGLLTSRLGWSDEENILYLLAAEAFAGLDAFIKR